STLVESAIRRDAAAFGRLYDMHDGGSDGDADQGPVLGNDILLGGPGKDKLHGEDGRDLLIGGADRPAETSRSTHRVPSATIKHWMDRWQHDLSVEDILAYQPRPQQ
ncbi:MAG: hypothetical protein R6U98_02035, partial [Pirellulaceae bacterium]